MPLLCAPNCSWGGVRARAPHSKCLGPRRSHPSLSLQLLLMTLPLILYSPASFSNKHVFPHLRALAQAADFVWHVHLPPFTPFIHPLEFPSRKPSLVPEAGSGAPLFHSFAFPFTVLSSLLVSCSLPMIRSGLWAPPEQTWCVGNPSPDRCAHWSSEGQGGDSPHLAEGLSKSPPTHPAVPRA